MRNKNINDASRQVLWGKTANVEGEVSLMPCEQLYPSDLRHENYKLSRDMSSVALVGVLLVAAAWAVSFAVPTEVRTTPYSTGFDLCLLSLCPLSRQMTEMGTTKILQISGWRGWCRKSWSSWKTARQSMSTHPTTPLLTHPTQRLPHASRLDFEHIMHVKQIRVVHIRSFQ